MHASATPAGPRSPQRLRKTSDFQALRAGGRAWNGPLVGIRTRANGLPVTRVGFSVGKRVGNAVTRNLVKRRLRAIVRAVALHPGFDIALSARPAVAAAGFDELRAAVTGLLSRARLLQPG